jgi:transforming growth factor-beta-induced protein
MKHLTRNRIAVGLVAFLPLLGCGQRDGKSSSVRPLALNAQEPAELQDIVDTAVGAGSFNTLATALGVAELIPTLKSDGPFTVFAPTDEAFAKIPSDQLNAILADKALLTKILTYHVVAGKLLASDVLGQTSLTSVEGNSIAVSLSEGSAFVNGSKIVATDVLATNGVIHVIDTVLLPPMDQSNTSDPVRSEEPAMKLDIVDTAVANGSFTILARALTEAGLIDTLKSDGPFTVFAPNDEAFAKIPSDQLNAILADKALLTKILTYHVVAGKLLAADVLGQTGLNSVQGSSIKVSSNDDGAFVNDSKIVATDVLASNGVIHVIDTVLLPPMDQPAPKDIVDVAVGNGSFTILARALTEAGLIDTLKSEGPFTVFAPTDEAFAKIPSDQLNAILADKALLTKILTYHVVAGKLLATDVLGQTELNSVQGSSIKVSLNNGGAFVNESKIVATDVLASNGVIHVIDTVLLPLMDQPAPKDIIDVAVGNGNFTILARALTEAGLIDILKGDGPFTVFAPTDEAFAKIPSDQLGAILADKALLTKILTYHVVAGKLDAATVLDSCSLTSVEGSSINVSLQGSEAFVNQSKIIATDVFASNGVIHVIDTVLLPPGL